jgi:hypothetical protein
MKIVEILKTSIFQNLHSRFSGSIKFMCFFSFNVHEISLQNRFGNELYPYIAFLLRFYLENNPKITPK